MTEADTGTGEARRYVGPFDSAGNVTSGTYYVTVYHQLGASPADSDPPLAQGSLFWDGTEEVDVLTIDYDQRGVFNVYNETGGIYP